MAGEEGEKEMNSWVEDFFDDFEEKTKEVIKKAPIKKAAVEEKKEKTNEKIEIKYNYTEGFFGKEIQKSKKEIISEQELLEELKNKYKGREIKLDWSGTELIVTILKEEEVEKKATDEVVEEETLETLETVETVENGEEEEEDENEEDEVEEEEEEEDGGLF